MFSSVHLRYSARSLEHWWKYISQHSNYNHCCQKHVVLLTTSTHYFSNTNLSYKIPQRNDSQRRNIFSQNDCSHNNKTTFNKNLFQHKYVKNIGTCLSHIFGFCIGIGLGYIIKINWNRMMPITVFHNDVPSSNLSVAQSVDASQGFSGKDNVSSNNNSSNKTALGRAHFNIIADVVEKVTPSVVNIQVVGTNQRSFDYGSVNVNHGSGFIVGSDGLILTNAHVVVKRQRGSGIQVCLNDGTCHNGVVQSVDERSDLALVKINAHNLPSVSFGDSAAVRAGEFVVAMGAPLALNNSISAGVVSSTSRPAQQLGISVNKINYIQTDAAITFGNSGGPLINLDGDVIGINCMTITSGISFAIPIDVARNFLEKVKMKQSIKKANRYIGVTMLTLTPDIINELKHKSNYPLPNVNHGVMIWKVVVGSPSYHAGLHPGDVITHVNGHEVKSASDVYDALERSGVLNMIVHRQDTKYSVAVTPEE